MKIWFINQYNMPPEYGHLNRHFNFGKYLKRMGHEPTVFVGSFLHNTKIQVIKDDSLAKRYKNTDFPYYFIRTCDYSSSNLKRIYAMYEFYKNLFKTVKSFENPDAILGSSAHPLAAIAAIKLSKKYGCQSIVEVRDLWPESFVSYRIIRKNNPLLKLLYAGEKWIYKNADKLVFTMEGGRDYIIEQGWNTENGGPINTNKVHYINNGVDLEAFNQNKNNYRYNDEDLEDLSSFKVVYIGSIRLVNKINLLIDVAKELEKTNVKFLIWGSGDQLEILKSRVQDEGISNLIIKGRVDKKYIPSILSRSNLNIMMGENSPLFKFGISPNKLFDYFASQRPTLITFKTGYSLIEKYNSGLEIDTETKEIVRNILYFKGIDDDEYDKYCRNALKAAEDYDYENLSRILIEAVNN